MGGWGCGKSFSVNREFGHFWCVNCENGKTYPENLEGVLMNVNFSNILRDFVNPIFREFACKPN